MRSSAPSITRRFWLAAGLGLAACSSNPGVKDYGKVEKTYSMRGEVIRVNAGEWTAVIKHDEIPGWMEAMTMEFPFARKIDFEKVKPGNVIRATVCTNKDFYWLIDVTVEK